MLFTENIHVSNSPREFHANSAIQDLFKSFLGQTFVKFKESDHLGGTCRHSESLWGQCYRIRSTWNCDLNVASDFFGSRFPKVLKPNSDKASWSDPAWGDQSNSFNLHVGSNELQGPFSNVSCFMSCIRSFAGFPGLPANYKGRYESDHDQQACIAHYLPLYVYILIGWCCVILAICGLRGTGRNYGRLIVGLAALGRNAICARKMLPNWAMCGLSAR